MKVETFYHNQTGTLTHLLIDSQSKLCVVIDPVLDFEEGQIKFDSIGKILNYINSQNLIICYSLDTHIHADHLTASFYLSKCFDVKTVISTGYLKKLQKENSLNLKAAHGYDMYVKEGDIITFGNIVIKVVETPGHTNTCISYIAGENIFCGDLMFMPDIGCGRCDFDEGNAETLFESGKKILSYPEHCKIYMGHDYPKEGMNYRSYATVKEQIKENIYFQINDKSTFKEKRELRDSTLSKPALFNESIEYNTVGILEQSVNLKTFSK